MPFNGDREIRRRQHLGNRQHGADRCRLQLGLARREENAVVDLDGHTAAGLKQANLALRDQRLQGIHDLAGNVFHLAALLGFLFVCFFGVCQPIRLGNRLGRHNRRALNDRDRLPARLTGRILESVHQRIRQHLVLALVDRGNRVHDHKECKQQGNEIGVGNEPALVVLVLFFPTFASH